MISLRRLLLEQEQAGRHDFQSYRANPALLPALRLARFEDTSVRGVLLRKLLLTLRLPASWLAPLESIAGSHRAEYGRFLCSLAYWQGVRSAAGRALWSRLLNPPVILMYHAVDREERSRYVLPLDAFNRQISWLRRLRRPVVSLSDLVTLRRRNELPPPGSTVLTFDDGYRDNIELCHPILARHGFEATIFVVTGYAGRSNEWDREGSLPGRPLLGWEEIRSAPSQFAFGGHSNTHPILPELDEAALNSELALCKAALHLELGHRAPVFAYPHGRFDSRVQNAVQQTGFAAACCSLGGTNEPWVPLYELRRVEIKGTDGLPTFLLALLLGMRIMPRQLLGKLLRGG